MEQNNREAVRKQKRTFFLVFTWLLRVLSVNVVLSKMCSKVCCFPRVATNDCIENSDKVGNVAETQKKIILSSEDSRSKKNGNRAATRDPTTPCMSVRPTYCISEKPAKSSDHCLDVCWISDDGLSRVFKYLALADLLSCACVCSQWHRCAHLPDAWTGRTVTVDFSLSADHSVYKPTEETTKVLKAFGHCIRDVKLFLPREECPYAKSRHVTRKIAWVEVSILVLAAAHAGHLSSLELHAFEHTLYKDPVCGSRRCRSITFPMREFLREVLACSPGLQRLVVNGLPQEQCALFRSSLHNVRHLRHFALNYTKDYDPTASTGGLPGRSRPDTLFPDSPLQIQILKLQSTYISEQFLQVVSKGGLPHLKKLVIVTRQERYNPFLLPTWDGVFRRLPKLRLGLFFLDVHMTPEEFGPFLRPDLPVTDLGFCTPSVFPSLQIEAVMTMIPDLYCSTLESFFLLGICGLFCQDSLVDIVRKCTKLTKLVVEPTLLAETVTRIAEAGRRRLKTLVVQWMMDRVKTDPTRLRLLSADDIQMLQNHVTAHLQQPSEVALHSKMAPNYRLNVEHFI
ncbi:uncharacterized protein LOC118412090 [Branchiostoma floridae]|uniref:Uncharacterized protein LOC118412090 n=1 Tax=Branchiostoma floridae TaxID=7739 RepID=A0A9J7KV07_BRAFL|nr:uncharacterized protein LOC118412090 [Branchiostoma floridae]